MFPVYRPLAFPAPQNFIAKGMLGYRDCHPCRRHHIVNLLRGAWGTFGRPRACIQCWEMFPTDQSED